LEAGKQKIPLFCRGIFYWVIDLDLTLFLKILKHVEDTSKFMGDEIEPDDSDFGGRRYGHRTRHAAGKVGRMQHNIGFKQRLPLQMRPS
jgi:hypothetical protein